MCLLLRLLLNWVLKVAAAELLTYTFYKGIQRAREASCRDAKSAQPLAAKCGTNCGLQQSSCHARTGGRQDRLRVVLCVAETGRFCLHDTKDPSFLAQGPRFSMT